MGISDDMEKDLRIPSDFNQHLTLPLEPRLGWCYIGSSGSDSSMHQDVVGTSAFNVADRKAWVFLEPEQHGAMYGG